MNAWNIMIHLRENDIFEILTAVHPVVQENNERLCITHLK